jgi:hypothetical protein
MNVNGCSDAPRVMEQADLLKAAAAFLAAALPGRLPIVTSFNYVGCDAPDTGDQC